MRAAMMSLMTRNSLDNFPQLLWKTVRKTRVDLRLSGAVMSSYTGSHRKVCIWAAVMINTLVMAVTGMSYALHKTSLERIMAEYTGRQFPLKADMRQPAQGASHAPMFNNKGWHFVNNQGSLVLRSGSRTEITGIFNYSENGFFIELAEASQGFFHEPLNRRRRMRVRIMVEAPGDDPELQYAQGLHLMARILAIPEEELPELPEPEADPDSPEQPDDSP